MTKWYFYVELLWKLSHWAWKVAGCPCEGSYGEGLSGPWASSIVRYRDVLEVNVLNKYKKNFQKKDNSSVF